MSQDLPVIHLRNDHMMVCPGNTVNPLTGHRIEGSSISSSYAQDNPLTGHRKKRRIERRVTIGCPLTGHRRKCSVITQETNENGLHRGGGGQSGGSGSGGGDGGTGAGRGVGGDEGGLDGNLDDKMLSTFLRTTANVDKSMTEIAAGDGGLLSEPIYLSANDQDYTPSSMRVNRGLDSVQSLDTFTSFGPIPFVDKVRAKSDRDLDYQQISADSRLTLNSSGSSMQPENVTVQCQEESSVRSNVNKNEANSPMDLEDSDNSTAMETAPSHSQSSSISIERGAIPVVLRNTSTPIKEYSTSSKYSVESLEPVPLESLSVESLEQQKHFISAQHSPNKALKENVGSSLMQTKALIRSFSCRLKQSLRRSKSNLESSIGAKLKDTKTSLHSIRLTPSSSPANNSGYKRSKLYSNNSADNIFHKSVSSHQSEKQWRHSFLCYSKSSVSRDNNNATTTTTRKPYFNLLAANRMMKNTSSSEDILKGKENHKRFILHANSNLECSNMKEPTILSSITCLDTSRTSSICNVSCNDENQDDSGIRHSKCKLNAPELTIKRLEDKPSGMGTGHEKKTSQIKMAEGLKNNVKTATSNNEAASDSRSMGNSESNQNRTKPILKSNLHRQNRVWKRSSKKRTINDTGSVSSDDNDHGVATKMAAAAASIVSTVTTASLTIANMATKAELSVIPRESPSHYYNNELHIQTLTPECSRYLLPNDCNRQGRLELTTFTGKNKDDSSASITASKCVTEDVTNTKGNKSDGGSSNGSSDSSSIFLSQTTSNCDEMEVKYENTSPPPPPSPTATAAPLSLSSPSPPLPPLALHYDTCDVVSPKYHRVQQQESGNDTGSTLQFPSPQQISTEDDAMEEDNNSSTTNNSSITNSSNNNNSSINNDVSAAEAKLPTFELLLQEIVKHHHQQTNDNNNYDNYNQRHSN